MAERYAAFISYSHQDRAVAAWLQRSLEGYRVPGWIVGRPGAFGAVPARIGAVFRDREDLPASADLAASVRAALDSSDSLIVLCSPAAAASRWVAAEITQFKARAGEDRVLALIVSGEPFASEMPREGAAECMPLPLRRHVGPDGEVSDRVAEPVAADLRHEGDGQRLARLKLIAGLLGIPLDMLIRREHARRQRGWALLAAASMAGTLTMGGLAWEARSARDTARARRADAEQLVDFMLGDLRKRLDAVGRLDVLDSVGAETMRYYARQKPSSLDADELARRARALRLVGELRSMRGDFAAAAEAFQAAAQTTGELLTRAPADGKRVFDHAQSVFWVGDAALKRGDIPAAARAFDTYAGLADRLTAIDPHNDEWRAEVASSRLNRGTIAMRRGNSTAAARDFGEAVGIVARLRSRKPTDIDLAYQLAQANAYQADAERALGRYARAEAARTTEIGIYLALSERDPRNASLQQALGWSQHALGKIALDQGRIAPALTALSESEATIARLLKLEPRNVDNIERGVPIYYDLSQAHAAAGDLRTAGRLLDESRRLAAILVERNDRIPKWRSLKAHADLVRAELALRGGDAALARWLAEDAVAALDAIARGTAVPTEERFWRARAHLLRARLSASAQPERWREVAALLDGARSTLHPEERCLLAAAYAGLGRSADADALDAQNTTVGYRSVECIRT